MNQNAALQKEWVKQQKREHQLNNHNEMIEEKEYAEQTETINRMRGMLEDEATIKKNNMLKEMQAENQRLAQEKRDREQRWREDQENQNQFEISRTNMSDFMTEDRKTTDS